VNCCLVSVSNPELLKLDVCCCTVFVNHRHVFDTLMERLSAAIECQIFDFSRM
jgi:hypothetical protein